MSSGPAMEPGVDHHLVRAALAPLLGDDGLDESLHHCVTAVAEQLDAAFAGVWILTRERRHGRPPCQRRHRQPTE